MTVRAFAALEVGTEDHWTHEVTEAEVDGFAALSGDDNPLHVDAKFARSRGFRGRVVHGMLVAAYLSRVIGTRLPGAGVLWVAQNIRFSLPVYVGDTLAFSVRVKHRSEALRTLVLETKVENDRGETVMSGEGTVMTLPTGARKPWEETVALVTGGSRGIGAAIAEAIGARGATVVVGYRENDEAASAVAARIADSGGQASTARADLLEPGGAESLAKACLDRHGRVDVLVSNASPAIVHKPFAETTWEEVDGYLRAYLASSFRLSQAFAPGMRERGFGRLVHVLTSAIWGVPPANTSAYVAAKSGLWGLIKAMAVEFAPDGVSVNAVSPSVVMTDQWEDTSDARRRAIAQSLPMRRMSEPEEVAQAVVFLAGDGGSYITGANLPVAGGEVM